MRYSHLRYSHLRYSHLRQCLWTFAATVLLAAPLAWANYDGPMAPAGQLPGTATSDNAAAGKVGEFVSSAVASGSAVPLTTSTGADITTISLTAGDWDVRVFCRIIGGTNTTVAATQCGWSQVAATLDYTANRYAQFTGATLTMNASDFTQVVAPGRISLSATTTIHMVVVASFGVSTLSAYGTIEARRVR